MTTLLAAIAGYALGSLPTAGALARMRGIDLRAEGSGNPGANNALRTGGLILAAGVLLPLSQVALDSERYGTRHRAAIGLSEQTDAVIVVVSEETGSISLVVRGRIERNLSEDRLRRRIFSLIRPQAPRQAAPLLRRTIEGRWGMPEEEPADVPIDPEDRVVTPAATADASTAPEAAQAAETAEPAQPGQAGQGGQAGPAVASGERRG